jgi:hypothetical protein
LLPAIKIRGKVKTGLILQNQTVHFKLPDLGDKVYLAITPLTDRKDRLLCMYLEGHLSLSVSANPLQLNKRKHELAT